VVLKLVIFDHVLSDFTSLILDRGFHFLDLRLKLLSEIIDLPIDIRLGDLCILGKGDSRRGRRLWCACGCPALLKRLTAA
jgi:hypothetical protein